MGVPRETLRLVRVNGDTRMMTTRTAVDYTDRMRAYAERRAAALASMDLRGYVLKKDSPSCGMERVKVFNGGAPTRTGVGIRSVGVRAGCTDARRDHDQRAQQPHRVRLPCAVVGHASQHVSETSRVVSLRAGVARVLTPACRRLVPRHAERPSSTDRTRR
jgi:hypothetical protein